MKKIKSVLLAVLLSVFLTGLAFAGGGSGSAGSAGSTNLSQQIMADLVAQTTHAGISLNGPENYWAYAQVENGIASLRFESGTIEPGRYIINVTCFNQDGVTTLVGVKEIDLEVGEEKNVVIELALPSSYPVKVYLANAADKAEVHYSNGDSGWTSTEDVLQDSSGKYIYVWTPMAGGSVYITSGVNEYAFNISPEKLAEYLDRGYAAINVYGVKSKVVGLQAQLYQGKLYPTDFAGLSLTEAAATVEPCTTIKLVYGYQLNGKVVVAARNVTIEGDPSFSCLLSSNNADATVEIGQGSGWAILKYLKIMNHNYQGAGAAVKKPTNASAYFSHCVLATYNGNSGISGNGIDLWLSNVTMVGDNSGAAFDLTGPSYGAISKSLVMGYGRMFKNGDLSGYNNIVWNISDTSGMENWTGSAAKDPNFQYAGGYYPGMNSPLLLPDKSYIGAIMPRKM